MTDEKVSPVSLAEFRSGLAAFGAPRRYIVAVSGGADSMALARLAAQDAANVLAVTVDHGLRAGSREEAETAGRWCRAAGLAHRILFWEGAKPKSGIQAAARAARYKLLAGLAEDEGCEAVLTAHTADDQAETVFMRLARGAGPKGLAGMAGRQLIAAGPGEPVALLRPLLGCRRARLVATLDALQQPFIDDPSNDDPGFERVRTRALLAALAAQDLLTPHSLCRTAARMRDTALRLDAADLDAFEEAGGCFDDAFISLTRWSDLPAGLAARILHAVSGGAYPPAEDEAATALANAAESGAATLAGAMLKRHRGRLFALREPAGVFGRAGEEPLAPIRLTPGERCLWDGRFIIRNDRGVDGQDLLIVPGGAFDGPEEAPPDVPFDAVRTCPRVIMVRDQAARAEEGRDFTRESLLEERFFGRIVRFR